MNRMMAMTINPGAVTAAVRLMVFGNAWPSSRRHRHQNQEERPEELREEAPPFLLGVRKSSIDG
jgi:hypothetical protein